MSIREDIAGRKVAQTLSVEDSAPVFCGSLLDCLLRVAELEGRSTSMPAVTAGLPLADGVLTPDLFTRAANRAGLAAKLLDRQLVDVPRDVLPVFLVLGTGQYAVMIDREPELGYVLLMQPETGESLQVESGELDGSNSVINISTAVNFASGFDPASVDQKIVVNGDLTALGADDAAIINNLLATGSLNTDGSL